MLDNASVYQIFYRSHVGDSKQEIARQLHVSRNCVLWHLSGRYLDEYDDRLFNRIRSMIHSEQLQLTNSKWIPLVLASYFFPQRPCPRALSRSYRLRTRIIDGLRCTTRDWISEATVGQTLPTGLLLTRPVCRLLRLENAEQEKQFLVPALRVHVPALPWKVVHRLVAIQDWTQMPFVTLTRADL
jgi:hypothetical protein